MGDKIKRIADNKRIEERFVAVPVVRDQVKLPSCKVCGAPAKWEVNTPTRIGNIILRKPSH